MNTIPVLSDKRKSFSDAQPILSVWQSRYVTGAPSLDWDIEWLANIIMNVGGGQFGQSSSRLMDLTLRAKSEAEQIRYWYKRKAAARAAAKVGDERAQRLLRSYEGIKRQCAVYAAHGRFSARGGEFLVQHSGYQLYDADDVPAADVWDLRCRLVELPETELVHTTPFGVRALVRVTPTPATESEQRDAFHAVDKWAQRNGLPLNDSAVKDIARLSYLWEDRQVRYTPGSESVHWTAGATAKPRRKHSGGKGGGGGDCGAPYLYLEPGDDDDLLRQMMSFCRDRLYVGIRNRGVFNALTAYAIDVKRRIDVQSARFESAVHSAAAACYESLLDVYDYDLDGDALKSARSVVRYQRSWEPDPDYAGGCEYTDEQRRNGGLKRQMLRRQEFHDRDLAIAFYLRKGLSYRAVVREVNRVAAERGIDVHCTISVVRSVVPRAKDLIDTDTAWRRRVCGSKWLGPVRRRQPAFQLRLTPRKDRPSRELVPISEKVGRLSPALGAPIGGGVIIPVHTEQVSRGIRCTFLCRCRSP